MNADSREVRAGRAAAPPRLPTMPSVACRVLALAECAAPTATDLHGAVAADPASVLAILGAAARVRSRPDCTSLRAAIERLGVARALRASLGFRLADRRTAAGMDCVRHWRCAVLTTAYARAIVRQLRRDDAAQIATAAALGCAEPLRPAGDAAADTADWLARHGVGDMLCGLVRASRSAAPADAAAACIALAARMADVWLQPDWERNLAHTRALAGRLFGAVPDLCSWVFGVLGPQAHDLEMLLQIRWPSRRGNAALSTRAQALLRRTESRAGRPAE